jgi:prepilin-type N-terminal cleavage/methylation domain-containing protein
MKKAFTIFELIIAIVIIGIASASLPMLLASANKADEDNINQDIFFKSTEVMNDIVSRFWDSNMYYIDGSTLIATVQAGDANLALAARPGLFTRSVGNGRQFYSTPVAAGNINATAHTLSSTDKPLGIDWYNGGTIDETAGGARVRYNIAVAYVPDTVDDNTQKNQTVTWNLNGGGATAAANSTNLKRITITATRTKLDGEVYTSVFSYFASNIGSQELKK